MRKILVANSKGGVGRTLISTCLAAHFAQRGDETVLADADRQKSARLWLAKRSGNLSAIKCINWSKGSSVDAGYSKGDVLIIDAPAGLRAAKLETLADLADDIVVPLLPSMFDLEATLAFIENLKEIKGVKKGKTGVYVVANRLTRSGAPSDDFETRLEAAGFPVMCQLSDRIGYARDLETGSSIFDRLDNTTRVARGQWTPLLQALG